MIRLMAISSLMFALVGCGTIGGALDGAGDDLSTAGEYIKGLGKE